MTSKRLNIELSSLNLELLGIKFISRQDNICTFIIHGPEKSFYEGHVYEIEMIFSDYYPYRPPEIKFITNIFHPNVIGDRLYLDIFDLGNWAPAFTIESLLLITQSLLSGPIETVYMNADAWTIWNQSKDIYFDIVNNNYHNNHHNNMK